MRPPTSSFIKVNDKPYTNWADPAHLDKSNMGGFQEDRIDTGLLMDLWVEETSFGKQYNQPIPASAEMRSKYGYSLMILLLWTQYSMPAAID